MFDAEIMVVGGVWGAVAIFEGLTICSDLGHCLKAENNLCLLPECYTRDCPLPESYGRDDIDYF